MCFKWHTPVLKHYCIKCIFEFWLHCLFNLSCLSRSILFLSFRTYLFIIYFHWWKGLSIRFLMELEAGISLCLLNRSHLPPSFEPSWAAWSVWWGTLTVLKEIPPFTFIPMSISEWTNHSLMHVFGQRGEAWPTHSDIPLSFYDCGQFSQISIIHIKKFVSVPGHSWMSLLQKCKCLTSVHYYSHN